MAKERRGLSKKIIALIVCATFIAALVLAFGILQIAFVVSDKITCWRPDYEKADLSEILEKHELTDGDYEVLYAQTGLTKIGVDRMLERGEVGKRRIKRLQEDYFAEHETINDKFAPLICTDIIKTDIMNVYLKEGDVLVTSSTHFSGFRIGHAGLVMTNSWSPRVMQASEVGTSTYLGTISDFSNRVNFMVFSPKVDGEVKHEVVTYARENLLGTPYYIPTGVLSSKNNINKTQCAHVVWYAYNRFGVDLDSNGGLIVTPKNLANSDKMELVQVFGFDPQKLWK